MCVVRVLIKQQSTCIKPTCCSDSSSSASLLSSGLWRLSSASASASQLSGETVDGMGSVETVSELEPGGIGGGSSTRGEADAALPSLLSPPPSPQPAIYIIRLSDFKTKVLNFAMVNVSVY